MHELNQGEQEEPTEPGTQEPTNETKTESVSITKEEESDKEPVEDPEPRVEPEEEPVKLNVEPEYTTPLLTAARASYMAECEAEFLQLSHYARGMVATEYERCVRFEDGLRDNLRVLIAPQREHDFSALVEEAKITEEVKCAERQNRDRERECPLRADQMQAQSTSTVLQPQSVAQQPLRGRELSVESTTSEVTVLSPLGQPVRVNKLFRDVLLEVQRTVFLVDLMELPFGEFNLILGIDWLVKHRISLDCATKRVVLRTEEDNRVVLIGELQNYFSNVIFALVVEKLVRKGCEAFLAYISVFDSGDSTVKDIRMLESRKEFRVFSDESHVGLGCVLMQDGKVESGATTNFGLNSDGVLCFRGRICVLNNVDLRQSILREAHNSHYAMHPGGNKMYQDLQELYWWLGLKQELVKISLWKWERVTMDFVNGLPLTPTRKDSIWVIVDRLTKSDHFISNRPAGLVVRRTVAVLEVLCSNHRASSGGLGIGLAANRHKVCTGKAENGIW
ncbi:uncharacterized protein LOC128295424 [Gossypium arboreum]|uniref:uncharacterized protein LOC128295424 n=1 Tax=Gossypium arboreum TaxID=29729 RepID=UPI0022F1833C|nr:uncharacterized protein LOC128295424 [Gossypium arboreum]